MINTKHTYFTEVKPPNVRANPLPDHGSSSGPSINMISIAAIGEEEDGQETPVSFIIDYAPAEIAVTYTPFVIKAPAKELYQDRRVPWNYGSEVANMEQEMSTMGITRSGWVYQGPELADKVKALTAAFSAIPETAPLPAKKVTNQEAKAFMKVVKSSKYKVAEQMGKSPAHISLLVLLLSSKPPRDTLLKVLTAAQVPKDTALDRIEETMNSIFSNQISVADDELPFEGQGHLRALHIMNVYMSRILASKTTVQAFDDSRREVGPCSFSITFQILEIANAFSLLLGRPWIHAAGAVPSSLHQKLKFFADGKLITINDEEDYVVYKETAVPYISIDYEEVGPSRVDRMIGKLLLKNDYVPGIRLGARALGILRPIEVEEYRNRSGLGFHPSCHEIVQARREKHLHRLAAHYEKLSKGILVPPLSQFFPSPPQVIGEASDSPSTVLDESSSDAVEAFLALPAVYAVTEETSSGVYIRHAREDEELTNWTAVSLYSAMVADV
ncbi:hypothetical protein CRG98_002692 [Punica granatum]|uniref:G-patch domain-containing protein n=1 Tax=Punica granatum TaxID=22663 RepID=A0A2I0L884_PUNGR|nr:hypothetical protein CRG98_002692 [Punica granatum]